MIDGPNRVSMAIEKTRVALAEVSDAEVENLDETMTFNTEEVIALQNHKSIAVMDGTLTLDEGNTVYRALGGEMALPDHINKEPLEVRVVLTKLLADLIRRSM